MEEEDRRQSRCMTRENENRPVVKYFFLGEKVFMYFYVGQFNYSFCISLSAFIAINSKRNII